MPNSREHARARLPLSSRAPVYGWLAPMLVREIRPDVWEEMRLDPIRPILTRLEPELGRQLAAGLSTPGQEALAEEFARLFLLPGGVSPFATSWLGGGDDRDRTRDEIVALVERGFAAVGREPVEREPWGRLAQDHVAVVLDLVSQAERSQDSEHREVATHLDRELVRPVLPPFGLALREHAKEPLYRALGLLILSLDSLDGSD